MKFYYDAEGKCVGCYTEGYQPAGTTAAPVPPLSGNQVWDGSAWVWPAGGRDFPTINARQIRLALIGANMFEATETAIAGLSAADKVTWEYATEYHRNHPLVVNLGAALGLTEAQIDGMWEIALTL